jgi:hypothetical protein
MMRMRLRVCVFAAGAMQSIHAAARLRFTVKKRILQIRDFYLWRST